MRLEINDSAGIRMKKSMTSFAIAAGDSNLPFLEKDCRNYIDKIQRLHLKKGYATIMHDYFVKMRADNYDFSYTMDLNEKGGLRNVLWMNSRSRAAFKEF